MKYKNIGTKKLVLLVDGNLRIIEPGEMIEAVKVFPSPSLVTVDDFKREKPKIVEKTKIVEKPKVTEKPELSTESEPKEKVKIAVARHAKKKDKFEWQQLERQD